MNKIYNPNPADWEELLRRPTQTVADIEGTVSEVFEAVRSNGDKAISDYTKRFDKVTLESILVSEAEIKEAEALVTDDLKKSIQLAKQNVTRFHEAQKTSRVAVGFTCKNCGL